MKIEIDERVNFSKTGGVLRRKTDSIVLHHACISKADVYKIHTIHLNNGWLGIGYHYYITKDGKVWRGRPQALQGSHCRGHNATSLGICLEGDFRKEKPTKEQIKSLKELVEYLKKTYPTIKNVYNHRDLFATQCPVVNLKEIV